MAWISPNRSDPLGNFKLTNSVPETRCPEVKYSKRVVRFSELAIEIRGLDEVFLGLRRVSFQHGDPPEAELLPGFDSVAVRSIRLELEHHVESFSRSIETVIFSFN